MPDKALKDKIATAKKRLKLAIEAVKENREKSLDDIRFLSGEQWLDKHKAQRDAQGRPCLTVNRLQPFFHQISNDQRQNRQAIKVNPVDDKGDPKTGEIIQGIIRHIEYDSDADEAYDTAGDGAIAGGEGYFRLVAEYESPFSTKQVIKIEELPNQFQVYLDPNAKKKTGSDAKWGFILCPYTKEEYEDEFGKIAMGWNDLRGIGDKDPNWMDEKSVVIAEYYYLDSKPDTLIKLQDGTITLQSKVEDGVPYEKVRDTSIDQWKWCKLNAEEELDSADIPGRFIPIFRVLGDKLIVNGQTVTSGIVRHAKDPQRHYNFMISESANKIALSNKDPWIAAEGMFEGHEQKWDNAHLLNIKRLEYKPKTIGGELAPPPKRDSSEPAIQAITEAQQLAADNIKAVTGIHDASLGAKGNETSGRAILARQQEGDVANFHYIDNLNKARQQCGRVCLDWIPVYYTEEQVMRIIGEDGAQSTAPVNQVQQDGSVMNDLSQAGSYDVTMSTGPSFQTKRKEAAETLLELSKSDPIIWQIAPDIIVQGFGRTVCRQTGAAIQRQVRHQG
jgi:hypothetical protein